MTANKIQIKQAVEKVFNVKVKAVNTMITKPKKRRVYRSKTQKQTGATAAVKKAVVTLQPGYDIDIFGDI
jgi:large subunit ribosomal protein L23